MQYRECFLKLTYILEYITINYKNAGNITSMTGCPLLFPLPQLPLARFPTAP